MIKDLSNKTSNTIVSYGERISSLIVATLIKDAKHYDSREFIKTEYKHSKHFLDKELTNELISKTFQTLPQVAVVPGFISTDKNTGDITNLGRGGSDYTAAIIAAQLDAEQLEIWTDVDGFMTADPRVISSAYTIKELTYVEATELCNFGAKVVYPPTIYPVCHKNIPILVKNTFNPEAAGTIIKQKVSIPEGKAIKGISSINDTALITVQGLGMMLDSYFVANLSLDYTFKLPHIKSITAGVTIYNLLSEKYESNGLASTQFKSDGKGGVIAYQDAGQNSYAVFSAQAPANFIARLSISF